MIRRFLLVQPSELKFPFELNKVCTCSIQLTNRTDKDVAFKVKTTHPKKYCVRPNLGIVPPGSKCVVEVIMQAQKASPSGVLRKDKFLVQSRIVAQGKKSEDVTSETFRKEVCNSIQEHRLRVVFVNANPPSPIPEASDEGYSSEASELENSDLLSCRMLTFSNAMSQHHAPDLLQVQASSGDEAQEPGCEFDGVADTQFHGRLSEEAARTTATAIAPGRMQIDDEAAAEHKESIIYDDEEDCWNDETISKLMEEKSMAVKQCSKLQQEWDKMIRQAQRSNQGNSTLCVYFIIVVFLGFLLGYIVG